MFRSDSRADLDRWVAGGIDEARFKAIYLDNWNYPWKLYAPILEYARGQKIALVGLNVSREITAQVALHGFDSLTSAQKGNLEGVTCDVSGEYEAYIRRAYGAHGHGRMDFSRFCQAQLVWDTAMAMNAIAHADSHPDTLLVILAGSGHARKPGIPAQLARRKSWPVAVLLPETAAIFDTAHISSRDADFLILNNAAASPAAETAGDRWKTKTELQLTEDFYRALRSEGVKTYATGSSDEHLRQIAVSTRFMVETNLRLIEQQKRIIQLLEELNAQQAKP